MRTISSIKNLISAWTGQIVVMFAKFLTRGVFLSVLSTEYLGLNGLFSNLLSIISFAELGIGTSIIYSMYEPVAKNDINKINSLIHFYKKIYRVIGISIIIIGIMLTPHLDFFIVDIPDIPNIKTIFLLYVLNSGISYFYSYKSAIITTNQKQYIINIYHYTCIMLLNIIQILILIITKSYILFLLIQVIMTFVENLLIARKANLEYPFISEKRVEPLDRKILNTIYKNTGALIMHKIGGIVVTATDNLIISKFLGLAATGVYSNYFLVTSSINSVLIRIFGSITASVGNLNIVSTNKKKIEVFNVIFFLNFWVYGISTVILLCIFNDFIKIWLGDAYLLDKWTVLIIVINFYLNGMKQSAGSFKNAMGLYLQDKFKPILEAIINLSVSILLAKKMGMCGVFMGTIISTLLTCFWIEPYVLFKYGFNESSYKYFAKWSIYTLSTIFTTLITFFIVNLIENDVFFIKLFLALLISNSIFIIIFCRTFEYKYIYNILFKIVKNILPINFLKKNKYY